MSNFKATFPDGTTVPFDFSTYPDKTENMTFDEVKFSRCLKESKGHVTINWKYKDYGRDLGRLLLISNYLEFGITGVPCSYFVLMVDYLPNARADRKFQGYSVNPLEAFCTVLNDSPFDKVITDDVHNPQAIEELLYLDFENYISTKGYLDIPDAVYIAPDRGAKARLRQNLKQIKGQNIRGNGILICDKIREGGKVIQTYPEGYDKKVKGKTCFIIDDICDGGRTFLELAEDLKAAGAERVVLVVTHGIFSQGLAPFYGKIDHIKVTNCVGAINSQHILEFNQKVNQ